MKETFGKVTILRFLPTYTSLVHVRDISTELSTELFILTYGTLVAQLCEDYEKDEDINKQLDKMGRNIGMKLVEDFLARSNIAQCRNFYETADVIAKVAFKMYLGVTPRVTFWSQAGDDCSLFLEKNPLLGYVEIPEKHSCLLYSNMICGILKGALKMVRLQVDIQLLQDLVKDDKVTEIRMKLMRRHKVVRTVEKEQRYCGDT
ncbi:trafficking protein particle complex subunit 3-like isoform X4 [Chiloscyllium plagiosum]|uniref:trafficking protein particle complex subunit 3-like isoform X4 n=1 Tax=Chiloscyllium plagiosum TaxID=36176 RepID=UPI001CB882F0|nr:trafficking protein particle complex subunit 3-like isoform X4 [Chiloscyllium plagiosum]